jgi:hypothetical protein
MKTPRVRSGTPGAMSQPSTVQSDCDFATTFPRKQQVRRLTGPEWISVVSRRHRYTVPVWRIRPAEGAAATVNKQALIAARFGPVPFASGLPTSFLEGGR